MIEHKRVNGISLIMWQYGQCAGATYDGSTLCAAPYVCTYTNPYYSQVGYLLYFNSESNANLHSSVCKTVYIRYIIQSLAREQKLTCHLQMLTHIGPYFANSDASVSLYIQFDS